MPGFSTSNSRSGPKGASSPRSRADWAAISNRLTIKRPNRFSVPSQERVPSAYAFKGPTVPFSNSVTDALAAILAERSDAQVKS